MIILGVIPSINLPAEDITRLVEIVPEGRRGEHYFHCRLPVDDPRFKRVLAEPEAIGRKPWTDQSRPPLARIEFLFRYEREYDREDLIACPLLELRPHDDSHVDALTRDEQGRLRPLEGSLNEQINFGFTMPTCYIVPDRVKRLLEQSDLRGVRFEPTVLMEGEQAYADTPSIPWEQHGPPWWELDSNFTMPPLADSMTFTDKDGKVLNERDFSNGFHRREGFYLHPELHYRGTDLESLPPFDLARTYEPFGNRKGYNRLDCPLVASQRFYRFCVDHGLQTGWVPVRIDP